jgi:hypothetical protein
MSESLHRDLGAHDEAISTLKSDVKEVRLAVARIEAVLAESKGGVRMLLAVGAIGGTAGAGLMKLAGLLRLGG